MSFAVRKDVFRLRIFRTRFFIQISRTQKIIFMLKKKLRKALVRRINFPRGIYFSAGFFNRFSGSLPVVCLCPDKFRIRRIDKRLSIKNPHSLRIISGVAQKVGIKNSCAITVVVNPFTFRKSARYKRKQLRPCSAKPGFCGGHYIPQVRNAFVISKTKLGLRHGVSVLFRRKKRFRKFKAPHRSTPVCRDQRRACREHKKLRK